MHTDTTGTEREQYHLISLRRDPKRLEALGREIELPKNFEISKPHTVPDFCYLIKSGTVMGYEYLYNGEMRIYNYMVKGSLLLEDCLLLDTPCQVGFRTTEPSTLIEIDKCDLKRAFKRDIDVVMDVCVSMADKFIGAMNQLRTEPIQPSEWKICRLLLSLSHYKGLVSGKSVRIEEKIRQQDIADLLGMNRVTVTRKLKELEDSGYISKKDGHYYINDIDDLIAYMNSLGNREDL